MSHQSKMSVHVKYLYHKKIMALIHALRLPNIIVTICCLFGARMILCSAFGKCLPTHYLWQLSLQTVLILMGGNMINDYFDRNIDAVNKPNRVWVGTLMPTWAAILCYVLVNVLAVVVSCFGDYGSFLNRLWLFYFPITMIGLFLYSAYFKCTPLLGNLMVATFCALVPLQVAELDCHLHLLELSKKDIIPSTWSWLGTFQMSRPLPQFSVFVAFAFLLTLWRELIKDLQDMNGDAAQGCKTLPVTVGENRTRWIAIIIGFVIGALLSFTVYNYVTPEKQFYYAVVLLTPCGIALHWLFKTGHVVFYQKASLMVKLLMLVGILALATL